MIQKFIRVFQVLSLSLILLILCYPLFIVINLNLFYKNKIYPRVKILNLSFEGKNKNQALSILAGKIKAQGLKSLKIKYQNKVWTINLNSLGFKYLPKKTVKKAYLFGRQKNWFLKWQNWKKGANFDLDYQISQNLLKQSISTISANLNIPAVPPTIVLVYQPQKQIKINPGQNGRQINQPKLLKLIDQRISQLNNKAIYLPVKVISSLAGLQQIKQTKIRANNLLEKEVIILSPENQWSLKDKEILNFLNFKGGFDKEKIASYTAQLAKSIDRPAQNALFKFLPGSTNNKVQEFKPAKNGQKLNQKKTIKLLVSGFKGLEKENNQVVRITLPVEITKPEISTQEVNNLGIKELIGQGESWFKGSIAGRVHNIRLAAKKLTGLLVKPQEIFSFNQSLGEVSAQTGFSKAYIIKNGRTVLGDGGGVCQVSTTLFRAVLNAGLPIEERSAHAYRVSYYEQNYQPGVDATVFAPNPDFKFKNDTPAYILIQAQVDNYNSKLTFFLYGTSDGRQATISSSRIWGQIPPPPDLYQDDPTLPQGVIKQVDWKAWGAKVAFDWKVIRGNEVLQQKTFYSSYKPWQAVFLKGTAN